MKLSKGILSVIILGFLVFLLGCATLEKGSAERGRLKEPRIKPVPESEWTEEQQKILNTRKTDGRILNLYTTLVRHPRMAEKFLTFSGYIRRQSTLSPRDREILILRIGWLCRAEYEFGQHTRVGKSEGGLTSDEISRITQGPNAPGWDQFDATLLRAVDELHSDAFITDATWNALAKRYDEKQLMDLVMTVGDYNTVSMFLNTMGVQLEEGTAGFPKGIEK
jgi:4-carboxymuconolactone decarboxylase